MTVVREITFMHGQAGGNAVALIHEVTLRFIRTRTIMRHRTGTTARCAFCGGDAELISIEAAARCAGVSSDRLVSVLKCRRAFTSGAVTPKSLVCLDCLSMRGNTGRQ